MEQACISQLVKMRAIKNLQTRIYESETKATIGANLMLISVSQSRILYGGIHNMADSVIGARYREIASQIEDLLSLEAPLVGIALADAQPNGVVAFQDIAPSACSFWITAQNQTFFASQADHMNCVLGAYVMGFGLDEFGQEELVGVMQKMDDCGYFSPNEAPSVPTIEKKALGAVYGPLASFPLTASVAVMWLRASQAMLVQEATGSAHWGKDVVSRVTGRPGCGALPLAIKTSKPVVSAGCTGMRTFTGIDDDVLLAALPIDKIEEFAQNLYAVVEANSRMRSYYVARKQTLLRG